MIEETESGKGEKIWKKFLRKHWKMLIAFLIGAIIAAIGAIYVYLWFVDNAQVTKLVPETLGLWSMGHFVTFIVRLIIWEVLFIGIPVLIAVALIFLLWWKKFPDEERKEYKRGHLFGKHSRTTQGGEGISFFVFIVFCIKVFLDGNWGVPFATWTFDYLVYSCLWAFIWVLIIIGIPILIGGTWWIHLEMKKIP